LLRVEIEMRAPGGGVLVGDAVGVGDVGADDGLGELGGDGVPPGAAPGPDAVGLGSAGAEEDAEAVGLGDVDALGCAEADTWVIARSAAPVSCSARMVRASLLMETSEARRAARVGGRPLQTVAASASLVLRRAVPMARRAPLVALRPAKSR
jgi:hypothetical protein